MNLHYGSDFCPGFWDWIDEATANGLVASTREVLDELIAGDDELSQRPAPARPRCSARATSSSVKKLKIPEACVAMGVR